MKKLLVVVLILVCAASWAQDTFGTGQWLHDIWKGFQRTNSSDASDAVDWPALAMQYQGYVWGAATVMYNANWLDLTGITSGQLFAVVGKYLDANPEQWNLFAEVLIYRALYAVWPGNVAAPASYQ